MNNLVVRSIAGTIFALVVIGSIIMGVWALGALFFLFTLVGLHEFYSIASADRKASHWEGLLVGGLSYILILTISISTATVGILWIVALLFMFTLTAQLIHPSYKVVSSPSITFMGVIYVAVPFALLTTVAMSSGEYDFAFPLGFFALLWINDSAAYFFGKYLGKRKLYEKVSPNKTWEGLFAGILFSMIVGWVLSLFLPLSVSGEWIVIAAIVAVFANIGDLYESQIKRAHDVKDSGSFIPGHGGVLDRFDGLFFSLPASAAYLYFVSL